MAWSVARHWIVALVLLALSGVSQAAYALTIELKDVAPDRIERQRAFSEGSLPLPGTPNIAGLDQRFREKAVTLAAPILIRIFKSESELEIWKLKGGTFVHFATYPICQWSGTIGPKVRTGDRQAPEGFYSLTYAQLRHVGRWPKSLHLGFPNLYDQSLARTGSSILVHPVMDEIHLIASAAMDSGQDHIPVHVFPFRMTEANMQSNNASPWTAFWVNLKQGYDAFERTKKLPRVSVCDGKYQFEDSDRPANTGPIIACSGMYAALQSQNQWLEAVPAPEAPKPAASVHSVAAKLGDSTTIGLPRWTFRCPVSLPTCHRYLNARRHFAARRTAWQLRGAATRRTWLAQDPPG
jgi:murein L,D-transpeptidase YafK